MHHVPKFSAARSKEKCVTWASRKPHQDLETVSSAGTACVHQPDFLKEIPHSLLIAIFAVPTFSLTW